MSVVGKWKCPNCDSTWDGSIGYSPPFDSKELNKMLHNICGCSGPIEDALTPFGSSFITNAQASEKRKILVAKMKINKQQKKDKDKDSMTFEDKFAQSFNNYLKTLVKK